MAENSVIGADNELPWRLSADLRRFRRLTTGHHIIMGRKTWESIGRLLPDRTTVIITRQPDYHFEGALTADSIEAALAQTGEDVEPFIVGGGQIYEASLPLVDRLYVTQVKAEIAGDATFPEVDWNAWRRVSEEHFPADEKNEFPHTFAVWERR